MPPYNNIKSKRCDMPKIGDYSGISSRDYERAQPKAKGKAEAHGKLYTSISHALDSVSSEILHVYERISNRLKGMGFSTTAEARELTSKQLKEVSVSITTNNIDRGINRILGRIEKGVDKINYRDKEDILNWTIEAQQDIAKIETFAPEKFKRILGELKKIRSELSKRTIERRETEKPSVSSFVTRAGKKLTPPTRKAPKKPSLEGMLSKPSLREHVAKGVAAKPKQIEGEGWDVARPKSTSITSEELYRAAKEQVGDELRKYIDDIVSISTRRQINTGTRVIPKEVREELLKYQKIKFAEKNHNELVSIVDEVVHQAGDLVEILRKYVDIPVAEEPNEKGLKQALKKVWNQERSLVEESPQYKKFASGAEKPGIKPSKKARDDWEVGMTPKRAETSSKRSIREAPVTKAEKGAVEKSVGGLRNIETQMINRVLDLKDWASDHLDFNIPEKEWAEMRKKMNDPLKLTRGVKEFIAYIKDRTGNEANIAYECEKIEDLRKQYKKLAKERT